MLTEQDMITPHWTFLSMVSSSATYKATTSAEEQIGIFIGQMGKGVECETVNGQ
jgi:hypothetical protein